MPSGGRLGIVVYKGGLPSEKTENCLHGVLSTETTSIVLGGVPNPKGFGTPTPSSLVGLGVRDPHIHRGGCLRGCPLCSGFARRTACGGVYNRGRYSK